MFIFTESFPSRLTCWMSKFAQKSTYKIRLFYGVNAESMQTVQCLLDTEAELNLASKKLVSFQWSNCIKRGNTPRLRTAAQEPLYMEGTILLHNRLGDLWIRVWFGIVDNLVIDILFGTLFIDRFICRIFPAEGKVVPWHAYSKALHANTPRSKKNTSSELSVSVLTDGTSKHPNNTDTNPILVRRQALLEMHQDHQILVTTTASGIKIIEPRLFEENL